MSIINIDIFRDLQLEIVLEIPPLNDGKYKKKLA